MNQKCKVLTEGHKYSIQHFESENRTELQFIEKKMTEEVEGTLTTVNDGITNEEVLNVLIDRMQYLQKQFPCRENAIVITKLQESLMWIEKRTSDRVERGVKGKYLK